MNRFFLIALVYLKYKPRAFRVSTVPLLVVMALSLASIACNLGAPPLVPTAPPIATLRPTSTPFFSVATATFIPTFQPFVTALPILPTIPSGTSCFTPVGWPRYAVRIGDTLYDVAILSGSTVETLIAANCLANPNLLEVGQLLYVPRLPSFPTTTPDNPVATKFRLYADPASVQGGQYVVSGQFRLVASGIRAGVRVVYYYSYVGSGQNYLGEGAVLSGFAQFALNSASLPPNAVWYITAVSKNTAGQNVQYTDVIVLSRADRPTPPGIPTESPRPTIRPTSAGPLIGAISINPAQPVFDPGLRYRVEPNTDVALSVSGLRGALNVRFLVFPALNAEPIELAFVSNPGNAPQVQTLWRVNCAQATGRLVAQAVGVDGQTSLSEGLDVFCTPP